MTSRAVGKPRTVPRERSREVDSRSEKDSCKVLITSNVSTLTHHPGAHPANGFVLIVSCEEQ
eukprot:scaffold14227_cov1083-Alexandrium_tamarense.AAC.1